MFFSLSTAALAALLAVIVMGAAVGGLVLGRSLQESKESVSEPFGVLQGALLGMMALILAFGLSLAVGRYQDRREDVVNDATAIQTTYLRAQTLPEPMRSRSLPLIERYTDVEIALTHVVPESAASERVIAAGTALQRPLWRNAAAAVEAQPLATAPRLYEESLNDLVDQQTVRVAGLSDRVPTEVLVLEIIGAAVALFLLGLHVGVLGRGTAAVILAAAMITLVMATTFDLDRPTRGFIVIPDTPLIHVRDTMTLPPAAGPAAVTPTSTSGG